MQKDEMFEVRYVRFSGINKNPIYDVQMDDFYQGFYLKDFSNGKKYSFPYFDANTEKKDKEIKEIFSKIFEGNTYSSKGEILYCDDLIRALIYRDEVIAVGHIEKNVWLDIYKFEMKKSQELKIEYATKDKNKKVIFFIKNIITKKRKCS